MPACTTRAQQKRITRPSQFLASPYNRTSKLWWALHPSFGGIGGGGSLFNDNGISRLTVVEGGVDADDVEDVGDALAHLELTRATVVHHLLVGDDNPDVVIVIQTLHEVGEWFVLHIDDAVFPVEVVALRDSTDAWFAICLDETFTRLQYCFCLLRCIIVERNATLKQLDLEMVAVRISRDIKMGTGDAHVIAGGMDNERQLAVFLHFKISFTFQVDVAVA